MLKVYVALDGTEFSTKEAVLEYNELKSAEDVQFAEQRAKFMQLREVLITAKTELLQFQDKCEHKYVMIRAKSDTGNWCKDDDSYWLEIECKCCESCWNEDQGTSKYRTDDKNVEWIR